MVWDIKLDKFAVRESNEAKAIAIWNPNKQITYHKPIKIMASLCITLD